jgi:hypothetical protein
MVMNNYCQNPGLSTLPSEFYFGKKNSKSLSLTNKEEFIIYACSSNIENFCWLIFISDIFWDQLQIYKKNNSFLEVICCLQPVFKTSFNIIRLCQMAQFPIKVVFFVPTNLELKLMLKHFVSKYMYDSVPA